MKGSSVGDAERRHRIFFFSFLSLSPSRTKSKKRERLFLASRLSLLAMSSAFSKLLKSMGKEGGPAPAAAEVKRASKGEKEKRGLIVEIVGNSQCLITTPSFPSYFPFTRN